MGVLNVQPKEVMLMTMWPMIVTMIRESRWTGSTLKFGLNIEESLGAVWWRTTQVIRTPSPPTLSSTLATWRPKLFDGTSLIWIWRSCEDIKSLFAPRSISGYTPGPVGPLGDILPWKWTPLKTSQVCFFRDFRYCSIAFYLIGK